MLILTSRAQRKKIYILVNQQKQLRVSKRGAERGHSRTLHPGH